MKKQFTLIEIALSLGVSFLAFTVLVAFFPTSFTRIKSAQDRSYATNAIAHFISYMKNETISQPAPDKFYDPQGNYNTKYQDYLDDWDAKIAINDTADSNPLPTEQVADARFTLDDLLDPSNYTIIGNSDSEESYIHQHDTVKSVYLLRNYTKIDGINVGDHTIAARVWKTSYTSATLLTEHHNVETVYQNDNDYDHGVRINIELSWPLSKAPSERSKTYTFFDIAK